MKVKTGQVVKVSGQYSNNNGRTEITLVAGKRVPPSAKSPYYILVDKTKHNK